MDLASLRMVIDSRDVVRGKNDLDSLAQRGEDTERRLNRSTRGISSGFGSMMMVIKQAAAIMAVVASANVFASMADQVQQLEARIRLVSGATANYAAIQRDLVGLANQNRQAIDATTSLYVKLAKPVRDLGGSTRNAIDITEAFGKALIVSGAAASESSAATLQFAQAMASGVLRGDEFNSVAEAAPRFLQAVADATGYAAGELRGLAADGQLTARVIGGALIQELGTLRQEAAQMPLTVGGAWQVLKNDMVVAAGQINETAEITRMMTDMLGYLGNAAKAGSGMVISAFEGIAAFANATTGPLAALKDALNLAAGAGLGLAFALNIGAVVGMATIALSGLAAQMTIATTGMTAASIATGAFTAALTLLARHPAIIVFTTIGAGIAYVNREYDKIIDKAQKEDAANRDLHAILAGLNDERERTAKLGFSSEASKDAQAISELEKVLRKAGATQEAINSSLQVEREIQANKRAETERVLAEEKQKQDALKQTEEAAKRAEQAAKVVANYNSQILELETVNALLRAGIDLETARQQAQMARSGAHANQIRQIIALTREQNALDLQASASAELADLQAVRRLSLDGLAVDEARVRVQMQRQGYQAATIDALLVERAAVEALAKAESDRAEASQVALEILREMKAEAEKQAEVVRGIADFSGFDFGADLAAGFDQASQSLGAFVAGFGDLLKGMDAVADKRKELDKITDPAARVAAEIQLTKKSTQLQMRAYGDIAGAAKGFFKEGTKGYKAMQAAEQVFRAYELASAAAAIATKLGLMGTETAAVVANEAAKQATYATTAQAAALTIPPPASFAALAAVVAVLASLGLGGRASSSPDLGNTGTGTVFGDPDAQSESIRKSIEYLGEAATIENRISSQMLASLRNIEANIGGLTNLIIRTGGAGSDLAAAANAGFKMDAIGGLITGNFNAMNSVISALSFGLLDGVLSGLGKIIGGLFGSKTKITGQGLFGDAQMLSEILASGFELKEYVDLNIKKKSFGVTTSSKNRTRYSDADDEIERQFSLIFTGFYDALSIAAVPLGVSLDEFESRLSEFSIDIGKINLRKLSGEEIQEKLEAVFGQQADLMAQAALAGLGDFQKVGEGYFETVIRVASGIEQADTLLQRLGLTAVAYTDILYKQGDVAAEIVRQSVLLVDGSRGVAGGFYEIVEAFDGTADEITTLVQQLRALQDQIIATGKDGRYLTAAMIAGAGGADLLTDGLDTYFSDFLSEAEQVAELTRRMTAAFNAAGVVMPSSIDAYRDLVDGIDISTEAGQKLYGQIIVLAPGFKELQDAMAGADSGADSLTKALTDAFSELRQAIKQAESDLQAAYNREAQVYKDAIKLYGDLGKSIREYVSGLTGAVDAPAETLARLRSSYDALIRRGKLGDSDAMSSLAGVGNQLRDAIIASAATDVEAARELARMQHEALAVAGVADRQKTIAEQQLAALDDSVDGLLQLQDNTLSVRDAIDNLRTLQTFENKAIEDATAAGFSSLVAGNGAVLSAIQQGTLASQDIKSALAGLLTIQQKQEADRQAELARQALEQQRITQIAGINAVGQDLKATLSTASAGRQAATSAVASLSDQVFALAAQTGVYLNAQSGAALKQNTATFGVNDAGLYSQAFSQITYAKNAQQAVNFKNEFYKPGGLYDQLQAQAQVLQGLKPVIDNSAAEMQRRRDEIIALGGVPQFATGGNHEGGWRVVGEHGPELEYTGPSRIYSAPQTRSMLDTSALEEEVKQLRAELRSALFQIAKHTGRAATTIGRWDDDGLPAEREESAA